MKTERKVVVIGGSAGSIDVLLRLLPALRGPLRFAIVVVIHRKNAADSVLATLLAFKTEIPLKEVEDKDPILPNTIYLAPADYHLLLEREGFFSLDDSEKINFSRPSIDVTFETAADVYGAGAVGILLSGANADGAEGLNAIARAGGLTVVQQPETARVDFMPMQALAVAAVDRVLNTDDMAALLNGLNRQE
ncbi:chemotaxis protein CheB [Tellurirhabdus rosea]|uniref:chemotaxis protein CheB n=1 Tax=Tellurirhabdus rosea TaxID=2674997 RepID=UPI002254952A|nr:chemotaxis protein CheB [Tellurirhabdus rosea]